MIEDGVPDHGRRHALHATRWGPLPSRDTERRFVAGTNVKPGFTGSSTTTRVEKEADRLGVLGLLPWNRERPGLQAMIPSSNLNGSGVTIEEPGELYFQPFEVSSFALPDYDCVPTEFGEIEQVPAIPDDVLAELVLPIRCPRLRRGRAAATIVAVPEAPVDEDHFAARAKHQVGPARQFLRMKAVPVTHSVHESPHSHFGLRVFGADAAHQLATLANSEWVEAHTLRLDVFADPH